MRAIFLAIFIIFTVLVLLLYKPLPRGFCLTIRDRFLMHIFETTLRITYLYPTRLMSKVSPMVMWTRAILSNMQPLLDLRYFFSYRDISTTDEAWRGVPVKIYKPMNNKITNGTVFFIHGGGFALGNAAMYDSLTKRMAEMLNTMVVSIDYRLSPETPFPGGLNDCENAIDYFFSVAKEKYNVDTSKIIVVGDSAGGNLATVLAQRRRLRGDKQFAGQVLMYPLLQMADLQSTSYRYYEKHLNGYALVDPESVVLYYMFYAGFDMDKDRHLAQIVLTNGHVSADQRKRVRMILDYDEEDISPDVLPPRAEIIEDEDLQKALEPWILNPDFSPLMREDLTGLPPAYIMTVEFDVLRDEGIAYGKRLQKHQVPTTMRHFKNGFHAFLNFHHEIEEAYNALKDVTEWIKPFVN